METVQLRNEQQEEDITDND